MLFHTLHLLSLGMAVGASAFFTLAAAPRLFATLGRQRAGEITALLFPTYYACLELCGVLAIAGLTGAAGGWTRWEWLVQFLVVTGGLGMNLHAHLVLRPELQRMWELLKAAPDAPELSGVRQSFKKLHGKSMGLNLVQMGLSFFAFYRAVQYPQW